MVLNEILSVGEVVSLHLYDHHGSALSEITAYNFFQILIEEDYYSLEPFSLAVSGNLKALVSFVASIRHSKAVSSNSCRTDSLIYCSSKYVILSSVYPTVNL